MSTIFYEAFSKNVEYYRKL